METLKLHITNNEVSFNTIKCGYSNLPATDCWQRYARRRLCYAKET